MATKGNPARSILAIQRAKAAKKAALEELEAKLAAAKAEYDKEKAALDVELKEAKAEERERERKAEKDAKERVADQFGKAFAAAMQRAGGNGVFSQFRKAMRDEPDMMRRAVDAAVRATGLEPVAPRKKAKKNTGDEADAGGGESPLVPPSDTAAQQARRAD